MDLGHSANNSTLNENRWILLYVKLESQPDVCPIR